MQNVQRWSENVMRHDGFEGRVFMGLNNMGSRKIAESKNCGLDNLTTHEPNGQNVEQTQPDGLTDERQKPEWPDARRELVADDSWLERPEHGNN